MFVEIIILVIIIFLYVHIHFHLSPNNELDIIEFNNELSKKELEKVCSLKQPTKFLFNNTYDTNQIIENTNEPVNVRQINSKVYVSVSLKGTMILMESDNTYYSDNNHSLIDNYIDTQEQLFLKPSMSIIEDNDIIIGEKDTQFPIRKMFHYRNYFYLTSGKVKITLYAPNNKFKPENISDDTVMLEYTLTLDKNRSYKSKSIEMEAGDYLFVPPYWYVQIDFFELSFIMTHKYQTIMSTLSFAPEYIKHYFKRNNNVVDIK